MPKKKEDTGPKALTMYTVKLTADEMDKMAEICEARLYEFSYVDHTLFAFKSKKDSVNIVGYKSGKLVIQGKGTEGFVQNTVEAEVTGSAQLGYEELHNPEWYEPHAGLDEAGKGDVFGPLVCCCVIADGDMVRQWKEKGVKDSKSLNDTTILKLDRIIRTTKGVVVQKMFAGMPRYNELMSKPNANLNNLMAWYHSKALQKALNERSDIKWGMLDQFTKTPLTQQELKKDGVDFDLRMMTKAESDPVVAAASICARAEFVRQIQKLSVEFGEELKKGASAAVKEQGIELVKKLGAHRLKDFAKVHFKTAYEILGLPVPKKTYYKR
jgi:ribonuclease HIII|tara:strand:+ start:4995 stop:5972 length:978 start_codon:yes stop_codon:yes gene_type:complete